MIDLNRLTRRARAETEKWIKIYRLQCEVQPSASAKRARQIVFGTHGGRKINLPPLPAERALAIERELKFTNFRIRNPEVSQGSIYKKAKINKRDWYRWIKGALPNESKISKRIEAVICPPQISPL